MKSGRTATFTMISSQTSIGRGHASMDNQGQGEGGEECKARWVHGSRCKTWDDGAVFWIKDVHINWLLNAGSDYLYEYKYANNLADPSGEPSRTLLQPLDLICIQRLVNHTVTTPPITTYLSASTFSGSNRCLAVQLCTLLSVFGTGGIERMAMSVVTYYECLWRSTICAVIPTS